MDSIETSEHLSDKYDFATTAESLEMELQDQGYHVVRLVRCLPTAQHPISLCGKAKITSDNHTPAYLRHAGGLLLSDRQDFRWQAGPARYLRP